MAAATPGQLDEIADRVGVTRPAGLPNPKILPPSEVAKLSIGDFPCYIVTVWDAPRMERVDLDPADLDDPNDLPDRPLYGSRWRVRYVLRVFTFARGATYAETNFGRFRYALALREAILGRPSMGDQRVIVDETSWREAYSELESDARAKRTIGAAYAEFGVDVIEDLGAPAPGAGEVLEVYTENLPHMVTAVPATVTTVDLEGT